MAREATITQEQVNAVADELRAAGQRPTARAVREALGGGSMATVLRLLQTWQAGQVRVPDAPPVLPAGLQRALADFIGQEVAAAKVSLEGDLAAALQANQDLMAESEHYATIIIELEQSVAALKESKATLMGKVSQLAADLAEARADAETQRQAAELARTEQAKLQLRLEGVPRLEQDLAQARAELEAERSVRVQAEQSAAVADARLEKTEQQAKDLRERLERAERDARAANTELGELKSKLLVDQSDTEAARREKIDAVEAMKRAEEAAAELRGQVVELREQVAELKGQLRSPAPAAPAPRSGQ